MPKLPYPSSNCRVLVLDNVCGGDLVEMTALKDALRSTISACKLLDWNYTRCLLHRRVMEYSGWYRPAARMSYSRRRKMFLAGFLQEDMA